MVSTLSGRVNTDGDAGGEERHVIISKVLSLFKVHVCVCVCVHVGMCSYVYVQVYVHAYACGNQRSNSGVVSPEVASHLGSLSGTWALLITPG